MELGLEFCSVASVVNFLPANFPPPTSYPLGETVTMLEGKKVGRIRQECAPEQERQGANSRNRKEGEHTFHGSNAEPQKRTH